MQSDIEVLLRLFAGGRKFARDYLPKSIGNVGFDQGGLFVPKTSAQVVFHVGQYILTTEGMSFEQRCAALVQQLYGLLWIVSEYGDALLADAILLGEPDSSSYAFDGVATTLQGIAGTLLQMEFPSGLGDSVRPFDEVFMRESFSIGESEV